MAPLINKDEMGEIDAEFLAQLRKRPELPIAMRRAKRPFLLQLDVVAKAWERRRPSDSAKLRSLIAIESTN